MTDSLDHGVVRRSRLLEPAHHLCNRFTMYRSLLALALLVFAAPLASAQGYGGRYGDRDRASDRTAPGVRIGISAGPSVYHGPDLLYGTAALQDNIVSTRLGVTGEISFPLGSEYLYGRLVGGVLNLGADSSRPDVSPDGANPFLTGPNILAEGDLMLNLVPHRRSAIVPYVFSGFGALFATDDALPGINKTSLFVPAGLGIEFQATRNFSLFGEASYRFGVNSVGNEVIAAFAQFGADPNPECVIDPTKPECAGNPCIADPDLPACRPICAEDPTAPGCIGEVIDETNTDFDNSFNTAFFGAGIRLGFKSAPRRVIPPPVVPPRPPLVIERPVPPPVVTPPPTSVCDLVDLNTVYFDYGSSTMSPRSRDMLNENVELLLENPACCVFVDGYTDTSEGDRFGIPLSGRRAQAVYDYYISRGVAPSKVQLRNRGTAVPSCDKEDPGQGCERNRRVESLPVDCNRFQF